MTAAACLDLIQREGNYEFSVRTGDILCVLTNQSNVATVTIDSSDETTGTIRVQATVWRRR